MNEPKRLYLDTEVVHPAGRRKVSIYRTSDTDVEYTRTDAFIEKAAQFLCNYNQKQALKHGAMATLGCGEFTINVYEFRKYMEGE